MKLAKRLSKLFTQVIRARGCNLVDGVEMGSDSDETVFSGRVMGSQRWTPLAGQGSGLDK
jgi:hypothetical protein